MDVRVATRIDRSPTDVFDYISDPHNDPKWISGIVSAEPLTGLPVTTGSRIKRIAKFLGKSIEYVLEVVDFNPNQLIGMRSVQAPFPMEVDYRLTQAGTATEFEIRIGGEAGGFYKIAGPLMRLQVKRSVAKDLANLTKILENPTKD